ncbi:MAG: hypothetical protein AAFO69_19575 [Bacteroidota bacterium]
MHNFSIGEINHGQSSRSGDQSGDFHDAGCHDERTESTRTYK